MYAFIHCFISLIFLFQLSETKDCIHRYYNHGSIVCVCNATYCDTIEEYSKLPSKKYFIYTSSKDGLRMKKSQGNFADKRSVNNADVTITLNVNLTYQEVLGWGGAFTDAAGYNINKLNPRVKQKLLRSYFSKDGIEYSLCRVPIGCSDLSINYYVYDNVPNDVNLVHFNITKEDYEYKIPLMKEALRLSNNTLRFFGSTWTAPVWMKTSNQSAGYGLLKKEYYQTWADYHIKFFDAYRKVGLKFWGVTTGNEPVLGLTPYMDITSLGWYPWDQGKWIEANLGPTIRNHSDYKDMKIIAVDDERLALPTWMVFQSFGTNANDFIDGIGVHWYTDPWFPFLLTLTHMLYPNKFVLSTEACVGDRRYKEKVVLGSWRRGEQYIDDIIDDFEQWVAGWVEWNIALDLQGGPSYIKNFVDASIIINATSQEFYKQPTYYTLGHFSKFVPPGSYKIYSDPSVKAVRTLAFKKADNGIVIIVFNKHDTNKTIAITDNTNANILIKVPRRSISTILYWL